MRIPTTYAGGARGKEADTSASERILSSGSLHAWPSADIKDLEKVAELSNGNVHLTFGSALDIFGGKGVTLEELIEWNRAHERS